MTALVIVESIFGNTRRIAEAVADGLAAARMHVQVVDVADAPVRVDDTVDLLVVGGPTHAFSLTRQSTRDQAAQQAGGSVVAARAGLREWLGGLARGSAAVATFDTKIARPRLPGSAAAAARKRLSRLGYRLVARPQSFWVDGTQGPLLQGEEQRARSWGESLATQLAGHAKR